jgi:hypothetical protein
MAQRQPRRRDAEITHRLAAISGRRDIQEAKPTDNRSSTAMPTSHDRNLWPDRAIEAREYMMDVALWVDRGEHLPVAMRLDHHLELDVA